MSREISADRETYDGWEDLAGHQACLAHIIRDYEDAAQCWPGAIWPLQAQRALRGLIKAWHHARDQGVPQIPEVIRGRLIREFRHAVLAGLADVPRIPGPSTPPPSTPAATCWNCATTGKTTCCGSPATPGSGPPATSASAGYGR